MVKEAIRIVIHVPIQFGENVSIKRGWIRQLKYSFLIGKVVAKGDSLILGSLETTVWDTTPPGEVEITENTEIEIEERPYFTWKEKGVHHGKFEDYVKWISDLRKKYGIGET